MQLTPEQQRALDEQKQHCPFCKMVRGEIAVEKVFEDDDFIAILDINPAASGHTLLVPKEHYPILPLMPQEGQAKLARHLAEMAAGLRRAMVTPQVETFIASGAAAGQQTSHFLAHLIPAERQLFHLPHGESETRAAVEAIVRKRFGTPAASEEDKDALSKALHEHEELRRMVIDNPDELIANLHAAPELAKLFHGVDIKKLSAKLKEQDTPVASELNDEQLVAFINAKDTLREMLVEDPTGLEAASKENPRLGRFFGGSSVAAVRERYLRGGSS